VRAQSPRRRQPFAEEMRLIGPQRTRLRSPAAAWCCQPPTGETAIRAARVPLARTFVPLPRRGALETVPGAGGPSRVEPPAPPRNARQNGGMNRARMDRRGPPCRGQWVPGQSPATALCGHRPVLPA
jgi:hypothetical protein